VAIAGSGGALGGGAGNLDGSIFISGGTVIATGRGIGFGHYYGGSTQTTINGNPVIFAIAINGTASNPGNGIASEGDVSIDPSAQMITLNTNFTVPEDALLTIPVGWTLNHTDYSLTNNGTIINHGTITPPPVTGVSLNKDGSSSVTVGFSDCTLYIDSPAAERIEVYSISGKLLHRASKPAGKASFTIPNLEQILIVRGSSGWVKKIEDR
jgi:hypothetical protein